MRSLRRSIGTLTLWAGPAAILIISAVSMRAEVLGREGLAGWDGTLEDPRGAPGALLRAARLEPWRADLRVAIGLCEKLPAAERERRLLEALDLAPSSPLAYLALGSLKAGRGEEIAARRLYRAGEALDQAGSATQIRLGALWIDLMDLDEALLHLRRAARISPDTRLLEALSLALIVTTDRDLLSSLVPEGAKHHLAAARFLEQEGIDDAAEVQYGKASAADAASLSIHESHVRFHLLRGERAEAVGLIRKRLPHAPGDLWLRLQLAQLLLDIGDAEEAGRELRESERLHPESEDVANQRALLELESGDAELAHRLAAELVARKPEMATARVTLARTLWKRGDRRGAAVELARAEALEPTRADVAFLLARLNREIGNRAAAAAYYRKAIERGYSQPALEELSALSADSQAAHGG